MIVYNITKAEIVIQTTWHQNQKVPGQQNSAHLNPWKIIRNVWHYEYINING